MPLVYFSWDSGPYSEIGRLSEHLREDSYFAKRSAEVPEDVIARYEAAERELAAAEEALDRYAPKDAYR